MERRGISTEGLGRNYIEEKEKVEKNNQRADNTATALEVCSILTPSVPFSKFTTLKKGKNWYMKGSENDEAWRELSIPNKIFHELGQGTYSDEVFEKYKHMTPVERGRAIWKNEKTRNLGQVKTDITRAFTYGGNDYSKGLLQTGPTSADRYFINRVGIGGTAYGLYEYIEPED